MDLCPFSGQPCPNRKTMHVTELKPDGSFQELHLCRECSNKYMDMAPETCKAVVPAKSEPAPLPPAPGVEPESPTPNPGLLHSLLSLLVNKAMAEAQKQQQKPKIPAKPPCPGCGMTIRDIGTHGRLGCAKCYDHFHEEMKIVTQHSHGATQHVGKKPAHFEEHKDKEKLLAEQNAPIEERIRSYKEKMANAIKVENYEAAGDLKKKIAELQSQLKVTDVTPPTAPSSGGQ